MRRYPLRTLSAAVAALVILSGCSSSTEPSSSTQTSTVPTSTTEAAPRSAAPVAPGEVGVSPDGVTTAVGAPAESTEDDYYQACRAATSWMDQQGGEPWAQMEPYLKTIQISESLGPGTFGSPWSELSPGQQAAVIVAVEAAVDGLCG